MCFFVRFFSNDEIATKATLLWQLDRVPLPARKITFVLISWAQYDDRQDNSMDYNTTRHRSKHVQIFLHSGNGVQFKTIVFVISQSGYNSSLWPCSRRLDFRFFRNFEDYFRAFGRSKSIKMCPKCTLKAISGLQTPWKRIKSTF